MPRSRPSVRCGRTWSRSTQRSSTSPMCCTIRSTCCSACSSAVAPTSAARWRTASRSSTGPTTPSLILISDLYEGTPGGDYIARVASMARIGCSVRRAAGAQRRGRTGVRPRGRAGAGRARRAGVRLHAAGVPRPHRRRDRAPRPPPLGRRKRSRHDLVRLAPLATPRRRSLHEGVFDPGPFGGCVVSVVGVSVAPSFDLGELYRRIDQARRDAGQSWASLARQVGVAVSTIRRFEVATDAEADGVLALVGWLGVAPEEFIAGVRVAGEPLPPADGGFVRVDMTRVVEVTGAGGASATTRTTIQRLVMSAQSTGRSVASLTRWSAS